MKNNMTRIWFDGSSSPHKKNGAGWGVFVEYSDGRKKGFCGALSDNCTNNQAELSALGEALKIAKMIPEDVVIFGDSKLVIDWYNAKVVLKSLKLIKIIKQYNFFKDGPVLLDVKWIPRRENKADFYAKIWKR